MSGDLIFAIVAGLMITLGIYMFKRNRDVYRYRTAVINTMLEICEKDERLSRPWRWRFDMYDSVTYDEMMYKFWKPLDSFYADKSFLED